MEIESMLNCAACKSDSRNRLLVGVAALTVVSGPILLGLGNAALRAQTAAAEPSTAVPRWQTVAGGERAFDVASIRQNNKPDSPVNQNVALDALDDSPPTGGLFISTNADLITYIIFAYKIGDTNQYQSLLAELPEWARNDRFDIEARAKDDPTKDQMRLMMQSLLKDRFKLAIHTEIEQRPVYALVLEKFGKTGPQLQPHPENQPCSATRLTVPPGSGPPLLCGALQVWQDNGQMHMRMLDMTMEQIASYLGVQARRQGQLPLRPVVDQTGLTGKFDFNIDFTPESNHPLPPGVDVQPDTAPGTTFLEALKEQLGLKLVKRTGSVNIFVIDNVEHPSVN
jgi:uncharacterized protein (TIGR03435 family)